jgi:hypothetical protein
MSRFPETGFSATSPSDRLCLISGSGHASVRLGHRPSDNEPFDPCAHPVCSRAVAPHDAIPLAAEPSGHCSR